MGKRISLCCHFPWKITTHVTTCMSYFAFSVFLEKRYIYLLGRSKRPPAGLWDITIPMVTGVVVKNLTGNNQKIRTFAGSWLSNCLFSCSLTSLWPSEKETVHFFLPWLLLFCGTSTTISWAEYNFYAISILYILNCPPFTRLSLPKK